MRDEEFLYALEQAEAEILRVHAPWAACLRELHGAVAQSLEDLEARVVALEELVAPAAVTLTAVAEGTKRCTACGEAKPLSAFWVDHKKKDGLFGKCKTCARSKAAQPTGPKAKAGAGRPSSDRICVRCGAPLTVRQVALGRNFCSKACFAKWRKGRPRTATYTGGPRYAAVARMMADNTHAIADYYNETMRPVAAREFVLEAGVGAHDGRRK